MAIEENKQIVLDWIQSGCNYDKGAVLYTHFGKNNFLKKDFPDKQHKHATKIIYELCKSVGLDYAKLLREKLIPKFEEMLAEKKPVKKLPLIRSTVPEPVEGIPEALEVKNITEYPPVLRRIIAEYAELFQERSKMHRIMTEMPEGNSQTLKTKRAEIFNIIKSISARQEFLYAIQKQYELNGEILPEDEIWPTPKQEAKPELPDDPEQLRKMKKNQQSANSKDQNMLDYQSAIKSETKKPMPAGPKRTRTENRMKARLKFIQEIDLKLAGTNAD
jgi:hypothetical protein